MIDLTKVAIHVPTQELSEKVQQHLFDMGYSWSSIGKKVSLIPSNAYNMNACIATTPNLLHYCPTEYWLDEGYTIIPAEKFLQETSPPVSVTLEFIPRPSDKERVLYVIDFLRKQVNNDEQLNTEAVQELTDYFTQQIEA